MRLSWTAHRSTLALLAPKNLERHLKELFALAEQKHNGFVTIGLSLPRKPRTTGEKSQNRHLNGHIQQLAQHTGLDFEVIKLEVKHQAISRGYPILYDSKGDAVLDLWGRVRGISEADCSTVECGYLIDTVHQIASEQDCILKEE